MRKNAAKKVRINAIILCIMVTICMLEPMTFSYYHRNIISIGNYSGSTFSLLILAVWFTYLIFMEKRIPKLFFFMLLFVMYEILTTSANGVYSIVQIPFSAIEMLAWLTIMFIAYRLVRSAGTIEIILKCGVISAIIFTGYFWKIYLDSTINVYGLYNAVYFPLFFLPLVLVAENRIIKWGGIVIAFAMVIVSYKRTAIIFFGIGMGYYIMHSFFSQKQLYKKLTAFFGIAFIIVFATLLFTYLQNAYELDWAFRISDAVETGGSNRVTIWENMLSAMKEQSILEWLLGHGYRTTDSFGGAHNDILEILYDYGIIGFGFYSYFCIQLIYLRNFMKRINYKHLAPYTVSLIFFFIYSFFGQLIIMPQWFFALCLLWGILIGDFENCQMQEKLV